jgi:hypothetical protein
VWLPWKYIIRVAARSHGFLDPITLLAQLSKFSQPSEVAEPIELLRAGVIFHARGLINSRVVQHNLDWVWPYWIEKQFDPTDDSFIPRAFSLTHVNLTHRNWTAIGLPNYRALPIVDPRGLLTPFWDKWSLDTWIITDKNSALLPSREINSQQSINIHDGLSIRTETKNEHLWLVTHSDVTYKHDKLFCNLRIEANSNESAWIVVSLRPYNPEGVSFINDVELSKDLKTWSIDKESTILFDQPIERCRASTYHDGDVFIHLLDAEEQSNSHCDVGMVTAAALFALEPNKRRKLHIEIPLDKNNFESSLNNKKLNSSALWANSLQTKCELNIPDKNIQQLYNTAIRTLILCSPNEVFPGPYTYKRFWYRDAAFIVYGLLCSGLIVRAEQALQYFPKHQDRSGYFHSQQGEWDSNGEVLWILQRFYEVTNRLPKNIDWWPIIRRGGKWIIKKRLTKDKTSMHAGLLPAGFSAEHLGPNDFYYWDDFWSIAGLRAAAKFADIFNQANDQKMFHKEALLLTDAVHNSLNKVAVHIGTNAMPASPYRRLDAGAIGSVVAGYPLQIFPADDSRLLDTVEFILDNCFVDGGFFQDMIHSGINPYLTLHIAQVLLRANDKRFIPLLNKVAELASPTGQWPEAVHPRTLGGCMGDGQHAWAAAEWIIMLRNIFVREENDYLVLCAGVPLQWLEESKELYFGPALTTFGEIKIWIKPSGNKTTIEWECGFHKTPSKIEVRLLEQEPMTTDSISTSVEFINVKGTA